MRTFRFESLVFFLLCSVLAATEAILFYAGMNSFPLWLLWLLGMVSAFCLGVALWHLKNAIFERDS